MNVDGTLLCTLGSIAIAVTCLVWTLRSKRDKM